MTCKFLSVFPETVLRVLPTAQFMKIHDLIILMVRAQDTLQQLTMQHERMQLQGEIGESWRSRNAFDS